MAWLDPLDLSGVEASRSITESSDKNAELLRYFADKTQENLQPFLDLSNRTLPALEAGATTGGFFDMAEQLKPMVEQMGAPVKQDLMRDLSSQLGSQGMTRSGFAGTAAADMSEDVDLSMMLQLQSMLTGRQQQIAGFGNQTGQNLSKLGTQSAEQLGGIQMGGIMNAAGAQAAGSQNAINFGGWAAQNYGGGGGGVDINQNLANQNGTITPQY